MDPGRYLTNHSSGKMGYALAKMAMLRGAEVTLVSGKTSIECPMFVKKIPVVTAEEMYREVVRESPNQDIIIKAAAVADYRPKEVSTEKVMKSGNDCIIELDRTRDILKYLGEHKKPVQVLCGFSMETKNMLGNSREKLQKKKLDMIVANNLKVSGAGFGGDTNVVTLITQEEEVSLPIMTKEEASVHILNKTLELWKAKQS